MEQETRERIRILNEKGILQKSGGGFHSPLEFAVQNLFYAVWSSRYLCSRLYSVRRESLEYYSVIYVLEGQMELEYEEECMTVRENEAVLLDFRKPHAYRAASARLDKWEMIFNGNAAKAYYELLVQTRGHRFCISGRLKRTLEKLMEELQEEYPKDHTVSMLIHKMLAGMAEQEEASVSPAIAQAIAYIHAHYGNQLQINEIADHVLLSRYYFTRLFRRETGRAPNEYLADVRIDAAREMLTEKVLPIAEIADRCGFTNTSHFTRFFREKTGQTPAAFRKSFEI